MMPRNLRELIRPVNYEAETGGMSQEALRVSLSRSGVVTAIR